MYITCDRTTSSLENLLKEVRSIAEKVRTKHFKDIEEFYENGCSQHDCYEINYEVGKKLGKFLGLEYRIIRAPGLDDYGVKHYVVEVVLDGKPYIVDAVPELTGLIPRHCDVGVFVGTVEDYVKMFETIVKEEDR